MKISDLLEKLIVQRKEIQEAYNHGPKTQSYSWFLELEIKSRIKIIFHLLKV